MGYHLANVIIHAITAAVFTRFAGQLFLGEVRPTLVSGLLFAAHPIHCEAVASVVGRADAGAGFFFLLSLMSYMEFCDKGRKSRLHLYLCLVLATLAMLTKETGISECAACVLDKFWANELLFSVCSRSRRLRHLSSTHSSQSNAGIKRVAPESDARGTLLLSLITLHQL